MVTFKTHQDFCLFATNYACRAYTHTKLVHKATVTKNLASTFVSVYHFFLVF